MHVSIYVLLYVDIIYIYIYISVDILFSHYQVLRTHTVHIYIFGGNVGENFWTTPSTEPCTPGLRGRLYVEPRVRAKRPHVGARIQGHPTLSPLRNTQKFDNKKHRKIVSWQKSPGEVAQFMSSLLCYLFPCVTPSELLEVQHWSK